MNFLLGQLRNTFAAGARLTPGRGESRSIAPPPVNAVPPSAAEAAEPQRPLRHLLLPLAASAAAWAAADRLLVEAQRHAGVRVHILHVTPRLPRHITRFLRPAARAAWVCTRTEAALAPVLARFAAAGIDHRVHLCRGHGVADTIIAQADALGCERIVMGAVRKSDIVRLFTGSITGRVLARSQVPVEVVLHGESSLITRFGVPAGVGLALFALILEID